MTSLQPSFTVRSKLFNKVKKNNNAFYIVSGSKGYALVFVDTLVCGLSRLAILIYSLDGHIKAKYIHINLAAAYLHILTR